MRSFLAALQFLTIIPISARLREHDFERAAVWFPLVGLLLGASAALASALLARTGLSGLLQSIFLISLMAALSGGLHLDGLADTADGFLSARPRDRVLEIMRDSRIGTMGVLALSLVLSIKVAAVCELTGSTRWKTMLLAPLAGRTVLVVAMKALPYVRQESGGLAAIFVRRLSLKCCAWAGLSLVLSAMVLLGLRNGAVCLTAVVIAAVTVSLWSVRRIGGFTGDTLGATSEIVEAIVLLLAGLV